MKRIPIAVIVILVLVPGAFAASAQTSSPAATGRVPTQLLERARRGEILDLIVEYEADDIDDEAKSLRSQRQLDRNDQNILQVVQSRFSQRKADTDQALARNDVDTLADYSHLPMAYKRFRSEAALRDYATHTGIKAIYENTPLFPVLAQSLPLINQPAVASGGASAAGSTIAIVDTGVDFTLPAFGSCTAVNTPASCVVNASVKFGTGSSSKDHGSNVAAIALAVATGAKVAALDVFSGTSASNANVISAINWSIANRATYNIVALNMSLGDSVQYSSPCSGAFLTPTNNARAAGINVVAAAGNNAFTAGISAPACTPGIVSVGAVYDANVGSITWGTNLCTDTTTAADKIACFSNSASFLSVLAPGALITAAGITEGGTSQASPHVAGALALLRSLYPTETLSAIESRITSNGLPITDTRNSITKPRLNVLASARPANDDFSARVALTTQSGSATGTTRFASEQSGEPDHAANASAQSVWWQWTAPATGQASINTGGSAISAAVAAYKGLAVNTLTSVVHNDNGSNGVLFQAQSGGIYQIAVDGTAGASGNVTLNWNLNTSAQANLAIAISGASAVMVGNNESYVVSVSNAGPQTATGVKVTYALPAGASYVSGPAGCIVNGNNIVCTVGTLANGASVDLTIVLLWNTTQTAATHNVSVTSDLPDSNSSNNSIALSTNSAPRDSTDVPLLPWWAFVAAAIALCLYGPRPDSIRSRRSF